jgi:adenylate cyclase
VIRLKVQGAGLKVKKGAFMASEGFKRKLTAILSADVKGYSRLMGEDEAATVRIITAYRETMTRLIQQHRGRVVDSPGDNLLAEFASVVDAVQCAVEIQEVLKIKNAELPEDRRMQFRIGINLGDVIEEGERIYGDGVNIAARVEGLAEGGGVCITGIVYDSIKNKLPLKYDFLGDHAVKNISEPVRLYRVQVDPEVPADITSQESATIPLPERPSIAVLPFVNMSGDPSQEYFGDGITEQIITGLSKIPQLFVIARNSTFTYKGQPVKVQQVGQELGVRYVLEGSVQRDGDRVRITAQLIDATTGHHLWGDNYDRDLQDIFALQDQITLKIMTTMQVKLTEGEQARLWEGGTNNIQVFDNFYQGFEYFNCVTEQDTARARQLFKEAIEQDPEFAAAYSGLAATHLRHAEFGWGKSPHKSMELAIRLAKKTLALNDTMDFAYGLLGHIYLYNRQYEKAIAAGERAIALNPNGAHAHAWLGHFLCVARRPEEGLGLLKKAIRLNPIPPNWYLGHLAMAYRMMGRYEEALEVSKQALHLNPDDLSAHLSLAITYGLLDREAEAREAAAEILKIDPDFSIEYFAKTYPIKVPADRKRLIGALRKAGLM